VTGVGDSGAVTYKKSRQGNAEIDRAFSHILKTSGTAHTIIEFFPYGYDERQYCSPGFNLPVGCFMRTPHGEYSEYHTSGDNLDFIEDNSVDEIISYHFIEHLGLIDTYKTLSHWAIKLKSGGRLVDGDKASEDFFIKINRAVNTITKHIKDENFIRIVSPQSFASFLRFCAKSSHIYPLSLSEL